MKKWVTSKLSEIVSFFDTIFQEYGFDNTSSFFKETFLIDVKYIMMFVFGFVGSVIVSIWDFIVNHNVPFNQYISEYVYNPSRAITLLFIITIVDVWFGTTKARSTKLVNCEKEQELIKPNKFVKSFFRFTTQVFFVAFVHNISNLYSGLHISWVVDTLMIAFMLATAKSAWNNAYLLGWIEQEVHDAVEGFFDLKKILFKIKSKKTDG